MPFYSLIYYSILMNVYTLHVHITFTSFVESKIKKKMLVVVDRHRKQLFPLSDPFHIETGKVETKFAMIDSGCKKIFIQWQDEVPAMNTTLTTHTTDNSEIVTQYKKPSTIKQNWDIFSRRWWSVKDIDTQWRVIGKLWYIPNLTWFNMDNDKFTIIQPMFL